MKQVKRISIVKDYSEETGLRHCDISHFSGEDFYHKKLNGLFYNALVKGEILEVDLDYSPGYAPSFLDEAFGNLIFDFTLEKVKNNIIIISEQEPDWKEMILTETFVDWENRRLEGLHPKFTDEHEPWMAFNGEEFVEKNMNR